MYLQFKSTSSLERDLKKVVSVIIKSNLDIILLCLFVYTIIQIELQTYKHPANI